MKTSALLTLCVMVSGMVGCSDGSSDTTTGAADPTPFVHQTQKPVMTDDDSAAENADAAENVETDKDVTASDIGREIGELVDTASQLAEQKQSEYASEMDASLQKLDARIEELEASASEMKSDAKEKMQERLASLREQKKKVAERLQKLEDSSSDAWQEVRSSLDAAWKELQEGVEKASDEFKQDTPSESK
ncbi:MAG: hypothetical protein RIK87_22615 [Fuerstiella sp.]